MLLQPTAGVSFRTAGLTDSLIVSNKNCGIMNPITHTHTQTRAHACKHTNPSPSLWHLIPLPRLQEHRGPSLLKYSVLYILVFSADAQRNQEVKLETSHERIWKPFPSSVSPLCLHVLWPKLDKMSVGRQLKHDIPLPPLV